MSKHYHYVFTVETEQPRGKQELTVIRKDDEAAFVAVRGVIERHNEYRTPKQGYKLGEDPLEGPVIIKILSFEKRPMISVTSEAMKNKRVSAKIDRRTVD